MHTKCLAHRYLDGWFQGYNRNKWSILFPELRAHFTSGEPYILIELMEFRVDKKCLHWFPYNNVCGGMCEEGRRRRRRGEDRAQRKLKGIGNGYAL